MPIETFVSTYSWLLAPGDSMQPDYSTPTRVRSWLKTSSVSTPSTADEKQMAYGQWIGQLLKCQLGLDLVTLYQNSPPDGLTGWPLTLRADVITELDAYFEADETLQSAMLKAPSRPTKRKRKK